LIKKNFTSNYEPILSKVGFKKIKEQILDDTIDLRSKRCFDFVRDEYLFVDLFDLVKEISPQSIPLLFPKKLTKATPKF